MRQGRFFAIDRSRVVQRQVLKTGTQALRIHARSRHHRWLISFAFMIAIVGSSGSVAAAPPIVAAHETGGGGYTSEVTLEFASVRLFDANGIQVAPELCPPCREP